MLVKDAVQKYRNARYGEIKDSTLEWYMSHLKTLVDVLGDHQVEEITSDDLRAWRAEQFNRSARYAAHPIRPESAGELSSFTKHGRFTAIKQFFKWLREEGYIDTDPTKRLKPPTMPKNTEPKAIPERDIIKLLETAETPRDLALLHVLDETGARVGGIIGLRLCDISEDHHTLLVTEKGDKSRLVYLSDEGAEALQAWLAVRPDAPTDRVFLSQHGKPITKNGIYQALRRLADRAGVERFNPHSFRHAFAREMINSGASLESVSKMLGHSGIAITAQSYAIWTQEEIRVKQNRCMENRKQRRQE